MSTSSKQGHWKVQVYLYDLSQGMAKMLSPSLLGKQIDGIWHSGLVCYGYEYFYGGGVQVMRPGTTMAGRPGQVIDIGYTTVTQDKFHEYLESISNKYVPEKYSLLSHNCNNFADEVAKHLCNRPIPAFITGLPEEALNTPMGQMLKPMIQQMENQMKQGGGQQGAGMIPWGASQLQLPRVSASLQPDTMMTLEEAAAAIPYQAPVASPNIQQSSTPSSTTTTSSSPAMQATATTQNGHTTLTTTNPTTHETHTYQMDHPHAKLKLEILHTSVTANTKPMTSTDTRANTFIALIKANNGKAPQQHQLTDNERKLLQSTSNGTATLDTLPVFDKLLQHWPSTTLFPVYGLLRILMMQQNVVEYYAQKGETFVQNTLLAKLEDSTLPMPARVMLLCTVGNMFNHPQFASKLAVSESVRHSIATALESRDQPVAVMGATVLYNIAITLPKDDSDAVVETTSLLSHTTPTHTDNEVIYRLLLALGHIVFGNSSAALLFASSEFDFSTVEKRFDSSSNDTNKKIHQLLHDLQTIATYEMEHAE